MQLANPFVRAFTFLSLVLLTAGSAACRYEGVKPLEKDGIVAAHLEYCYNCSRSGRCRSYFLEGFVKGEDRCPAPCINKEIGCGVALARVPRNATIQGPVTVKGKALDSQDLPFAGAVVKLHMPGGQVLETRTAPDGGFQIVIPASAGQGTAGFSVDLGTAYVVPDEGEPPPGFAIIFVSDADKK
jgi:hypothetical protein